MVNYIFTILHVEFILQKGKQFLVLTRQKESLIFLIKEDQTDTEVE